MTTGDLTTRQRVEQEVARHFALIAEKEESRDAAGKASTKRNEVLNSTDVADATEKLRATREATDNKAIEVYQEAIIVASKPMAIAQEKYNKAEAEARSVMEAACEKTNAAYENSVETAQKKYELALAIAEAEVHRSKAEVAALEQTLSQHRDEILRTCGIDLNALTVGL